MNTSFGGGGGTTVINSTANTRYVPFPTAPNTPGQTGDRALHADGDYAAMYNGDGMTNHSWVFYAVEPLTSDFFV